MRHSMKFKVVLAGFVFLFLAVVFLAAVGYHMVRREVLKSAHDTLHQLATIKGQHLLHILNVRSRELAQVGNSPELMNYHERGNPYALGRYMVTLSPRYPYLVYISRSGYAEIEVIRGEVSFVKRDCRDDPLVKKSMKVVNRTVVSKVFYSKELGGPAIKACFTRINYFDDFVGTLCVQIPASVFFFPLQGSDRYLFVVTMEKGQVLYPRGRRVSMWLLGNGRSINKVNVDGRCYMVASYPLKVLGLNLYALGDLRQIMAPVYHFGASNFLISVLVLFLATAGLYLGSRKVIQPLEELTVVAKKVATTGELVELGEGPKEGEVGHLYMAFKSMMDKLRESHLRLKESESHSRLLAEGIPEMVFSFDKGGRIGYVNARVEELLGVPKDEFLQGGLDKLLECVYPQDRPKAEAFFSRIVEEGSKEWVEELRILPENGGKPRYVMLVVKPSPGGDAFTGLVVDLTVTKRLEQVVQELDEAHMELVRVQKMAAIGRLASGVAHEINNPLMAIVGYAEKWIEEVEKCNPALANDLHRIYDASMRAAEIVRALQLFSSTLRETECEVVDVEELLSRTLPDIKKRLEQEGVRLEWRVEESLSPLFLPPHYLREIVVNLVGNARDAIVDSGKGSRIDVEVRREGGDLIIRVSDDGPGIPEGIRSFIFDPFFTTKPPGRGTGLGLSMVQQMVENLGGAIRVESVESKGTTFVISVPCEPRRRNSR